MEMQQLRYVVAVARAGNFSRAAAQCHVAQPSLSQQIQKLEEELGERLFHRLRREVKLTAHGEVFLGRAVRILAEAEAAKREAAEAHNLLRGTLAIGVLPTIAPYLLPRVMAEFAARFSGVELVVQEDTTEQLLRLAQNYEIDFALASLPIQDSQLAVRELFTEPLLLTLPPGHPLARKRHVTGADLAGESLMVMKAGHCLGDQMLGFCDRHDVRSRVSFRSSQLGTIQALVAAGLGISLVPAMAAQTRQAVALEYRPFRAPAPERKIVAVWPEQRPLGRAATEFLKLISTPKPPRSRR